MGKKSRVVYQPLGTILLITPWNYPFYQGIVPAVTAFLAGNAIVLKPSEVTPLKPLWDRFQRESGFLKDALQVVYGGRETGAQLIEAGPDKVHFTGSVAAGKKVMAQCAPQLIPVDLELGGKDLESPRGRRSGADGQRRAVGLVHDSGKPAPHWSGCTCKSRFMSPCSHAGGLRKRIRSSCPTSDPRQADSYDMGAITAPTRLRPSNGISRRRSARGPRCCAAVSVRRIASYPAHRGGRRHAPDETG